MPQIHDNTAEIVAGRQTIDNVKAAGDTQRLAELITEVHELALREEERRFVAVAVGRLGLVAEFNDLDAIRDLAVRTIRNWRLSLEHPEAKRYTKWCTAAATELEVKHGVEIARVGHLQFVLERS